MPYKYFTHINTMYAPGDLLRIHGDNDEDWFGEIVECTDSGLEVHLLERTRDQGGRIWRFTNSTTIRPLSIRQHVKVSPITRETVKAGWKQLGFVVDIHNFAKEEDFNSGLVYLDLEAMDDAEETDVVGDGYDYSDGFVVPVEVANEPFTFADPDHLDPSAAAWVKETHDAVRKYNNWTPSDRSGMGIKRFVDNLATKASNQANDARWAKHMREIDCRKPPAHK